MSKAKGYDDIEDVAKTIGVAVLFMLAIAIGAFVWIHNEDEKRTKLILENRQAFLQAEGSLAKVIEVTYPVRYLNEAKRTGTFTQRIVTFEFPSGARINVVQSTTPNQIPMEGETWRIALTEYGDFYPEERSKAP